MIGAFDYDGGTRRVGRRVCTSYGTRAWVGQHLVARLEVKIGGGTRGGNGKVNGVGGACWRVGSNSLEKNLHLLT